MTDVSSVEELVRRRLGEALGGLRGVVEGAVPTIAFTVTFLASGRQLKLALIVSIALTVVALAIRLVQRSNPQFVVNALVGIALAAVIAAKSGEARNVFLPGIIYNAGYAVVMAGTVVVRWPLVGLMVGGVVGDLTQWRRDPGMVRLCSRLTWLLILPCIVRVVVQYPLWRMDEVGLLGVSKIVLGWPLQLASLAAMGWLLSRNGTPLSEDPNEVLPPHD